MNRPMVVAGVTGWVASLLAAALYLVPTGWRGGHDLAPMALWSLAFAVVVALAAHLPGVAGRAKRVTWAYGSAIVLGPTLGFACFVIAVSLRGGWRVAFPVFSCWAFGGLLGLVAATMATRPRTAWVAGAISLTALAMLLWSHAVLRRLG